MQVVSSKEAELSRRRLYAEQYQARIEAAQNVQLVQVQQMLMTALKELKVLEQTPSPEMNDVNLVAHRHAKLIFNVVNGQDKE